jgi:histidine triad (HIT) family protein
MRIRLWAAHSAFRLLQRFPGLAHTLLPWIVTHMGFAISLHKLRDTPTLLAFYHPQPAYPVHILILPKRSIASLADLSAEDAPLLVEIIQTAQSLVEVLELESRGYRLIVNGGAYQELPQLHFHLVSSESKD